MQRITRHWMVETDSPQIIPPGEIILNYDDLYL